MIPGALDQTCCVQVSPGSEVFVLCQGKMVRGLGLDFGEWCLDAKVSECAKFQSVCAKLEGTCCLNPSLVQKLY